MMKGEAAYRAAVVDAEMKRARMMASLQDSKDRIRPGRLKQDVTQKATSALIEGTAQAAAKARARPIAVGAAILAFILYLARRPLAALGGRLYVRIKTKISEIRHG